jgi:hypothetical protein
MAILQSFRVCVFCIFLIGSLPTTYRRSGLLHFAFAERTPTEDLEALTSEVSEDLDTSSDTDELPVHRVADISRADSDADETEGSSDDLKDDIQDTESLEVRASPRTVAFQRHSSTSDWEERERALRHQLELTREERGEAEALQASEQRETKMLERKLELATEKEQHMQELLTEAKQQLAAKNKEVSGKDKELNQYLGLADDLRVAASEASESASRAKEEAEMAKRKAMDEKEQARRDLEEAKEDYEQEADKARNVQAIAEATREKSLVQVQRMAQEEYTTVQQERLKAARALATVKAAEEQRQKHFKAAAAMRVETEEAQALVEQARNEKAAAQQERSKLMWEKQEAYRYKHNAGMFSLISWGVLAFFVFGTLSFVMEVHKWESARLTAFKLLSHLPLVLKKPAAAPAAEAVPLPALQEAVQQSSLLPPLADLEEITRLSDASSDGLPAEAEEAQLEETQEEVF